MARIRTIKPEFWADEKLAPLDPIDRLVFLGLISMADDCGRVLGIVKVIDAFIFPVTDHSSRPSIATLIGIGVIRAGATQSGQSVYEIVGWAKHQKIDRPNRKAALPSIDEASTTYRRSLDEASTKERRTIPTTYDLHTIIPVAPDPAPKRKALSSDKPTTVQANWVQEAMVMYEHHIGMLTHGRLGKALKPAVEKWGWGGRHDNQVHQWFDAYVRHKPLMRANGTTPDVIGKGEALVKNTQFCSPEDFVKNLAFWREYCTPPAPDPLIIDARIPKAVPA